MGWNREKSRLMRLLTGLASVLINNVANLAILFVQEQDTIVWECKMEKKVQSRNDKGYLK